MKNLLRTMVLASILACFGVHAANTYPLPLQPYQVLDTSSIISVKIGEATVTNAPTYAIAYNATQETLRVSGNAFGNFTTSYAQALGAPAAGFYNIFSIVVTNTDTITHTFYVNVAPSGTPTTITAALMNGTSILSNTGQNLGDGLPYVVLDSTKMISIKIGEAVTTTAPTIAVATPITQETYWKSGNTFASFTTSYAQAVAAPAAGYLNISTIVVTNIDTISHTFYVNVAPSGTPGTVTASLMYGLTLTAGSSSTLGGGGNSFGGLTTIPFNIIATGTNTTATMVVGSGAQMQTALGGVFGISTTGTSNTVMGSSTTAASIGSGNSRNIFIGAGADLHAGINLHDAKAIGVSSIASSNEFVCGSTSSPTTNVYFGNGDTNAAPQDYTISGTFSSTNGVTGGNIFLAGGAANQNADAGGAVVFQTARAGAGLTTTERLRVSPDGGIKLTGIATANQPATSGASNGTIYFDSTLNHFYASENNGAYAQIDIGIVSAALGGTGNNNATPGTGTFLRGNGTGFVTSTLTLPNTATQGDLLTATGANAIGSVADVAVGRVLTSGGVSTVPAYSATPTLGVAGTTAGTLSLAPAVGANTVTVGATNSTAAWTLSLPVGAGTVNYPLLTDGSGNASWNILPVAGGGTGLATLTNHSVQVGAGTSSPTQIAVPASGTLFQGNAAADPTWTATPTLGVAGTTAGKLTLAPATGANSVTLAATNSTAAWTFSFPTGGGANTNLLQTDGSGNTSWVAATTGANPTASVTLSATNGTATTYMRSDAAPPLSQAIAPTWTAVHQWSTNGSISFVVPQLSGTYSGGNTNCVAGTSAGATLLTGTNNVLLGSSSDVGANAASNVVCIGQGSISPTGGTVVGSSAGKAAATAARFTSIGHVSGAAITSGADNTFVGDTAGTAVTTSPQNTLIGSSAGKAMVSDATGATTMIGYNAGIVTTGSTNIIIGASSAATLTTGTGNIVIGKSADVGATGVLNAVCIGLNAVAPTAGTVIGKGAGNPGTTAPRLTSIGNTSGHTITSGADNTFLGDTAGTAVTTSPQNTLIGSSAGKAMVGDATGATTMVGYNAGTITTGASNTFLGASTAATTTTGTANVVIGKGCDTNAAGTSNAICIGGVTGTKASSTSLVIDGSGTAINSATTNDFYLCSGDTGVNRPVAGVVGPTTGNGGTTGGDWFVPKSVLTAGTMTVTNNSLARVQLTRFDWTNAMVIALGAVTSGNVSVCTLPAKTRVINCYVVINTAATGTTTLTVSIGRTSATFIDYIVAKSAQAAANTVYGAVSGDRGTNLTMYDLPSITATTVVNAQFVSTGANLSAVLTSTGTVYLETETLP